MTDVGVFLGGEGKNELGRRAGAPTYQTDEDPGVLQTLLRRVENQGWTVAGAVKWADIRKYPAKGPLSAEERNVLGLVVEAQRSKAEVVAFIRDADDTDRHKTIEAAIGKARSLFPNIDLIGGTAVPVLEGWILAMRGQHGTEKLSKAGAQKRLDDMGVDRENTTSAMVRVVTEADLERLPEDARSLRAWLDRARGVLPARVRKQGGSANH